MLPVCAGCYPHAASFVPDAIHMSPVCAGCYPHAIGFVPDAIHMSPVCAGCYPHQAQKYKLWKSTCLRHKNTSNLTPGVCAVCG